MRKIKQIEVIRNEIGRGTVVFELFAVCEDGTLWHRRNSSDNAFEDYWEFVPGPPEGQPDTPTLTLEEQAAELNKHTGTFLSENLRGDDDI